LTTGCEHPKLFLNTSQTFLCKNVQDHSVLETAIFFKIILYWKRLKVVAVNHIRYNLLKAQRRG